MWDFLLVGLGGACGAMSRFGVQHLGFFDHDKYYYTVGINLTGCMTIGILWALFGFMGAPRWLYHTVITGFLGGYTTYSAFSLDAILLFQNGRWVDGLLYLAVTFIGGLGLCWLGWWLTQRCFVH